MNKDLEGIQLYKYNGGKKNIWKCLFKTIFKWKNKVRKKSALLVSNVEKK